jgi:SNF2 family DNA or RNA helicase
MSRLCRIRDKKRLASEFDIVVTTYATLGSDFGGKKNAGKGQSPLNGIKWHRIVFDEGE